MRQRHDHLTNRLRAHLDQHLMSDDVADRQLCSVDASNHHLLPRVMVLGLPTATDTDTSRHHHVALRADAVTAPPA